jgi:hypothetical protein
LKIFFFYLFSGLFIFLQIYFSVLWAYFGTQTQEYQNITLVCSFGLPITAFVFLFNPILSYSITLILSLVINIYYFNLLLKSNINDILYSKLVTYIVLFPNILAVIIFIHSLLYITKFSKKFLSAKTQDFFYPTQIHRNLAYIILTGTILVMIGIFSAFLIFVGVQKKVTQNLKWTIEEDKFYNQKKIILTFPNSVHYKIEINSNRLAQDLLNSSELIPIEMDVLLDFGILRSYQIKKINNKKVETFGNAIFYLDCKLDCPKDSIKPPWE